MRHYPYESTASLQPGDLESAHGRLLASHHLYLPSQEAPTEIPISHAQAPGY